MRTSRKRAILQSAMPRMPDALEAKLYDLLQAHQLGHAYFTGPGMPFRYGASLLKLMDLGYAEMRRSHERPGVCRWWITPLGVSYFEYNEEHNPLPPREEPRSLCLLRRVQGSRAKGEVFTTSPGSSYEAEMLELKRRGYLRSRMIITGHKAGRLSWTITPAGRQHIDDLSRGRS
jgi:hypothetical protein